MSSYDARYTHKKMHNASVVTGQGFDLTTFIIHNEQMRRFSGGTTLGFMVYALLLYSCCSSGEIDNDKKRGEKMH